MRLYELFSEKVRIDRKFLINDPALVLIKKDGAKITYSWFKYKEKVLQIIKGLEGRKVKPGEFVAIIALNLPESFFAMLGTILMGAVPVPINATLLKEPGQQGLRRILDDCQPVLVLGNKCLWKLMPEECLPIEKVIEEGKERLLINRIGIPIHQQENKEMLIMTYTSGTSGKQKGVMQSEAGILDRVAAIMKELKVTDRERVPSYMPLDHITELVATFFGQIYSGYTIYFTEEIEELIWNRPKFREKVFPKFLQQVQPTIFPGAPKIWMNILAKIKKGLKKIPACSLLRKSRVVNQLIIRLVKKEIGFTDTRIFISAGAPIDELGQEGIEFFRNLQINLDDIYGQTETGGPILLNGLPIGSVSVTISNWNEEIEIRSKSIMLGYFNNPEATAEKRKERMTTSGKELVYLTGDTGKWNKRSHSTRGYWPIRFTGRLDDGFKLANGEFVSAPKLYELENELKKIEEVEEAIVCGEGKQFLVALIFADKYFTRGLPCEGLTRKVRQRCQEIGEGLYKIKACYLADKDGLEYTATMKVKKKEVIKKFQGQINTLTNRE